jgi:segregation and condensation protein B
MSELNAKQIIEALLIATDVPLNLDKITAIAKCTPEQARAYVEELNQEYGVSQRAFEIKEIAGGFQIYTLPAFAEWVGVLHDQKSKLSKAALETLAIIAYHQPITRPEIEKFRGVDSSWVLDTLLQKGLIRTSGRLPVPGRPIQYVTTKEFLRYFGINDIKELPCEEDFGEKAAEREIVADTVTPDAEGPAHNDPFVDRKEEPPTQDEEPGDRFDEQ